MRLIKVNTGQLTTFDYRETTPQYAILSHTWSLSGDKDEITFQDIQKGPISQKKGQQKLDGCYKQAKVDGLEYVWVDTCCINKANFSELQESLNSMFRWYEDAAVCYVYLDDVRSEERLSTEVDARNEWGGKPSDSTKSFHESRWFQRGWTLQELLAPTKVEFYDVGWQSLGSRHALSLVVEEATGIPGEFLSGGASFRAASVAQRMSWAANRTTKKPEDIAYCLFGVFDVVIPLHYGEGAERAFVRLQEEIMRRMSSPDDSILAWNLDTKLVENDLGDEISDNKENRFGPILATRPDAFKDSGGIIWEPWDDDFTKSMTVSGGFLNIQLHLHPTGHGATFGLLNCYDSRNNGIVSIPLSRFTPGPDPRNKRSQDTVRLMRPEGSKAILLAKDACRDSMSANSLSTRQIHAPENPRISQEKDKRFSFRFEFKGSFGSQLRILEVYPRNRMKKGEAYIVTGADFHHDCLIRAWVRLGEARTDYAPAHLRDFVLLLELEVRNKMPYPRCHVMVASRETKLETLSTHTRHEPTTVLGQMSAGTNVCSLQANLTETRRGGYQSYLIVLEPLDNVPTASIDVTDLVMLRERSSQVFHFYKEGQDVASKFDNLASTMFERRAYGDMKRQRRKILLQQMDALQQKMKDIKKEDNRLKDELQEHQQLLSHDSNELERLYMEQRGMLQRQSPLSQLLESIDISKTESLRRRMCHDLSLMLASEDPHIDSMSNEAEKLIMKAAFNGNVVALQLLCSLHGKSTDLSFEDGAGRGLLSTAISGGSLDAAAWLLKSGLSVNSRDTRGMTALGQAACQGSLASCHFLLNEHADLNIDDKLAIPPLILAVVANQAEVVRFLLARKAYANAITPSGWPALAFAAKRGYVDIMEALLDNGADINMRSPDGWAPIFLAIQEDKPSAVRLLLDRGADLQPPFDPLGRFSVELPPKPMDTRLNGIEDVIGFGMIPHDPAIGEWTALGVAACHGNLETAELLLTRGAHFEARNTRGRSPLLTAASNGHHALVSLLLDQKGLFRGAKDVEGGTALNIAAGCGHYEIARLLISHEHWMVNEADREGITPLMMASRYGQEEIVNLLLCHQPQLERRDVKGLTALALSMNHEKCDIIMPLLIKRGADIHTTSNIGETLLHIAITNGRRQAVELLLEEASAVWLHDGTVPSALQYASKLSQTYSAVAGVAKEILDILLALPTPAQNQAGSAQTQALTGGELTIPTDQSLLSNEGPSSSQYPKKGKTRIPARLVSRRALIDLGYPHIEEGKTIIVLKALGQDNIDELLTLSEEYRMSEREQGMIKVRMYRAERNRGTIRRSQVRFTRFKYVYFKAMKQLKARGRGGARAHLGKKCEPGEREWMPGEVWSGIHYSRPIMKLSFAKGGAPPSKSKVDPLSKFPAIAPNLATPPLLHNLNCDHNTAVMLTAGGLRSACPSCRARILRLTGSRLGATVVGRSIPPSSSGPAVSQSTVRSAGRRTFTTTSRRFQDSETSKPDAKDLSRPDDIETVVREAKQRFRDTLPKGYLSEEEYRLYERWYGPPLRETSPEDVGIEYLNEKVSEARVRHDGSSEPALLRQVEGGSYEEVSYVRKGVSQTPNEELGEIIEDNVTSEISTEVEPTEEVEPEERENYINIVARNKREYDALMKLQKDFEANARAFEESERAQALAEEQAQEEEDARDEDREFDEDEEDLDEMEDGIQDQGISNRAGRLHPLTRDGHFSTNPSTVALPYVGYISPVTTMLGRTDIKHVQEAAERAFGGPGLPYSPATPASKMNLPQQPVGMAVWQARMSEIDADAFVSTFLPPAYASAMGSLVEVRKRLGTEWLRKLFERGDGEGPRVLDVGAGGAGLLAWQDVTRAEWDAMKSRGEVTAKAPPGKQSVVIGAEKLRLRISKFLQNTTFLPRLPDYIHSFENQHLHVDANQTPQPRKMFDVIIASHLLLPVKEGHRRKAILNQLWSLLNPEGGVLIVLEKGQPRGFEAVAEVRDRLLDEFLIPPGGEGLKAEDEMETSAFIRVKEPGMIIAPCTNHKSCPMYLVPGRSKGRKDYCHFTQRFVRPPFLQKIMGATQRNHDDVQFSYVAIQRGVAAKEGEFAGDEATDRAFDGYENAETAPDMLSLPRQILPPIKRRGHVTLDVCTPSAHIERWTVPKSFSKQAYHDARKAKWGDLWALGAKTRMRRNVRLGKPEAEDDGGVRAQRAKEAARRSKKPVNVDLNEQGVVGDPDAIAKAAEPRRRKTSRQTARQDLNKRVQNDD